jgi:hypothetical protein
VQGMEQALLSRRHVRRPSTHRGEAVAGRAACWCRVYASRISCLSERGMSERLVLLQPSRQGNMPASKQRWRGISPRGVLLGMENRTGSPILRGYRGRSPVRRGL